VHRTSQATDRRDRPFVTVTLVTRSVPAAADTHVLRAYGVRAKASRYSAACTSVSGCRISENVNSRTAANDACSATSSTRAPAVESDAATGSMSGPVPAITTRFPENDTPCFSSACAPPIPTTPGSVQPGNGRNRSRAPVAITTARARTTTAPPPCRSATIANAPPASRIASTTATP